jgi:hypothetical protein
MIPKIMIPKIILHLQKTLCNILPWSCTVQRRRLQNETFTGR